MAAQDPERAVADWCAGRPFEADAGSVRILKERASEHRRVYYVTFRDAGGGRWNWTLPVDAQPDGSWEVAGGAGGGGGRPLVAAYMSLLTRVRGGRTNSGKPWANLGGGNWPDRFYAGGRVEHDRGRAARVRLTCANGLVLEDSVDDGRVLFVTERRAEVPVVVELLGERDDVVARHRAFEPFR
jgi:hypothetical protein